MSPTGIERLDDDIQLCLLSGVLQDRDIAAARGFHILHNCLSKPNGVVFLWKSLTPGQSVPFSLAAASGRLRRSPPEKHLQCRDNTCPPCLGGKTEREREREGTVKETEGW